MRVCVGGDTARRAEAAGAGVLGAEVYQRPAAHRPETARIQCQCLQRAVSAAAAGEGRRGRGGRGGQRGRRGGEGVLRGGLRDRRLHERGLHVGQGRGRGGPGGWDAALPLREHVRLQPDPPQPQLPAAQSPTLLQDRGRAEHSDCECSCPFFTNCIS